MLWIKIFEYKCMLNFIFINTILCRSLRATHIFIWPLRGWNTPPASTLVTALYNTVTTVLHLYHRHRYVGIDPSYSYKLFDFLFRLCGFNHRYYFNKTDENFYCHHHNIVRTIYQQLPSPNYSYSIIIICRCVMCIARIL